MKFTIKLIRQPLLADLLIDRVNITYSFDKKYKQEAKSLASLEADKFYEIEVKEKPLKKTLSQNAYAWSLIRDIADKAKLSPTELYRKLVRETSNYIITRIPRDSVAKYQRSWALNGDGWFSIIIAEGQEWTELRSYYGMSAWDKKAMSDFIESLIEEANELGVPVERGTYGRMD